MNREGTPTATLGITEVVEEAEEAEVGMANKAEEEVIMEVVVMEMAASVVVEEVEVGVEVGEVEGTIRPRRPRSDGGVTKIRKKK